MLRRYLSLQAKLYSLYCSLVFLDWVLYSGSRSHHMGRGNKRNFRRDNKGGRGNGDVWRQDKKPRIGGGSNKKGEGWLEEEDKHNEDFNEFYKAQGIVPEEEWEDFIRTLRKTLPVTFRINGSGRFADHLRDKLESDFFSHFGEGVLMVEGEPVNPPRPLPWYPNKYAWHMDFTRSQLRKMPLLEAIHDFMKKADGAGSISRQEAVSMVPPLFMDVQPHHAVLDMCAAPGSKTFQLLEALHAGDNGSKVPRGFIIANDANTERCNLLTHQLKRICSPCLLISNHSAEYFPVVHRTAADGKVEKLKFDRILCDVPCSGDGTMRKAPDIWRRWSVAGGNGLHIMQLRIALHGCELLKVGGRMVYSTCAFNPIEDEAVIAELLALTQGAMELVDMSSALPELRRMPGKTHWKVKDKFSWYNSWEEARAKGARLEPSMFPSKEMTALPLHRCMRFLPHHQDTGGFFVAVLRKVAELPTDFQLPVPFMKRQTEQHNADGAAPSAQQIADPLEAVKQAAQEALGAAERCLAAMEAGDATSAGEASAAASRAAALATAALEAAQQQEEAREVVAALNMATANDEGAGTATDDVGGLATAGIPGNEKADDDADMADTVDAAAGAGASTSGKPKEPSWFRGGGGRNRLGGGGKHKSIDPIIPVEDPEILQSLVGFYGLSPHFPLGKQLIARSTEATRPKRLYYVSESILDIMLMDAEEQLKIISTGLKVFERQEIKEYAEGCAYRLAQEGLPLILPYISKQRVYLGVKDFLALLRDRYLMLPPQHWSAGGAAADGNQAAAEQGQTDAGSSAASDLEPALINCRPVLRDPAVLSALEDVKLGCFVAELRDADAQTLDFATGSETAGALAANAPLALSAWKGKASIAIMVDKNECTQMVDKIVYAQKQLQQGTEPTVAAATSAAADNGTPA